MNAPPLRHLLATACALAVLSVPLAAQMNVERPGARDASRATSGTYDVDRYHTLVGWRVDHMGITPYLGLFGDITGTLVLDKEDLAKSTLDITIPVSRITTASAELNDHLFRAPKEPGGKADFFGPDPADAHFVMTALDGHLDLGSATMTGDLTLNGITKPVRLDVEFYGAGKMPEQMGGVETIGFIAGGKIKRSDFDVSFGIPMIADDVQLSIVAGFVKKPG